MEDLLRDLLEHARAGERAAWDELYASHAQELHRYVRRRLGFRLRRKMDPADLVQSVYLEAFEDLDRFDYRGPKSFAAWLRTLAESKLKDRGRRFGTQGRDVGREVSWCTGIEPPAALAWKKYSSPSRHLRVAESAQLWERAFESLSARHQEVLRLHRLEGLPTREVADRLGCTQRTVQLRIAEAMIQLAEIRGRMEGGDC